MPSTIYVPCSSLKEEDIMSLVHLASSNDEHRVDKHGGRKVALLYLLTMKSIGFDLSKWISNELWNSFEKNYENLKSVDYYKKDFCQGNDCKLEPYWELTSDSNLIHPMAKQARRFHRKDQPFENQQLKIYFNHYQIENLPYSKGNFAQCGFVDEDSRENLIKYPINQRHNVGSILTMKGRIEQLIFEFPSDHQLIILDFADERMPGGLFLEGATTQEETICYHSETYRALLDLKYHRFQGGFFIPEFGCLYLKDMKFYHPTDSNRWRFVDVVAGACYDLTGQHGLYPKPRTKELVKNKTKQKFETIVAAAQANSNRNGEKTSLLLGPIGCGAFQNDLVSIVNLWHDVLTKPLDPKMNTEQRHAFNEIVFLSGTEQRLNIFRQVFQMERIEKF